MEYRRRFPNVLFGRSYVLCDASSWRSRHAQHPAYQRLQLVTVTERRRVLEAVQRHSPEALSQLCTRFAESSHDLRDNLLAQPLASAVQLLGQQSSLSRLPVGARLVVLKEEYPLFSVTGEPITEESRATNDERRAIGRSHIAFEFVTRTGEPVANIQCEIILADGEHRHTQSSAQGMVSFSSIAQGECTLILRELDGSSWEPESGGTAVSVGSTRPFSHVVQKGECLARIAHRYGIMDWPRLWHHTLNEPLRRKRKDPNVLYPGDEVVVAGRRVHELTRATGRTYRILVQRGEQTLTLLLEDHEQPLANEPYELRYTSGGRHVTLQGASLDSDGKLQVDLPSGVERAVLFLPTFDQSYELELGHLHAAKHEDSGQAHLNSLQARLNALGYECGAPDGQLGERTTAALAQFQRSELDQEAPTGALDATTLDALIARYGA